jgi:hypothetical protein
MMFLIPPKEITHCFMEQTLQIPVQTVTIKDSI